MHYFWKGGITILDKNTRNVHNHYSLRKLSVGLVSVLIGLNLVEANNTHKVKADTLADNSDQETNGETPNQSQSFAIVGQIIPVDHKQQEIKNAPRPYYQRDPNDPSKAIATPAPKVDGYHVRKNNQASNYDHETNLVTPPADPSQNTYLVYAKKTVKKSVKDQKKSKDNTDRTSNIESSKNKEIKNTPQIQNNKKTGGKTSYSSIRENNKDEQVRESVRKTGLFGFGKKKQTDSGTSADEKQTTEPSQTVAAQAQGAQVETTQPSESNNEVEKKSAEAKSNKITEKSSKNKDTKKTKKTTDQHHNQKKGDGNKKPRKPKNTQYNTEKVEAIMNPKIRIPPKPLVATLNIVDHDNHDEEITKLDFEGKTGEKIIFDNLKQVVEIHNYDGYETSKLINSETDEEIDVSDLDHIDFGDLGEQDVTFTLYMKHKVMKLTKDNANRTNLDQLRRNVSLTVHYENAGAETPEDHVENAVWSRQRTYDLVLKQIVPGEFDTDWKANPQDYQAVKTPVIEGYQADIAEVAAIPVEMESINKVVKYEKIPDQKEAENTAEEVVKEEPVSESTKESHFTVNFVGAGEFTPAAQVQSAEWTKKSNEDNWTADKLNYQDVTVPVVAGFHASKNIVKGPEVSEDDINVEVSYSENGAFIPVDEHDNVIGDKQIFITDPRDASQVLSPQRLSEIPGYKAPAAEMKPYDAGKEQQVFYQKVRREFLVDQAHPSELVSPDEYIKQVKFTVEFTGAGEKTPEPITQTVELTRSVTCDNTGTIIPNGQYSTDWTAAQESFNAVEVPQLAGYQADYDRVKGPEVGALDATEIVQYKPIEVEPEIEKATAVAGAKEFVETVHFVDQNGNELAPDQQVKLVFSQDADGSWDKKIDTFKSVMNPVVNGYFTKHKHTMGKSVMVDDADHYIEVNVQYQPVGKIIPVDAAGNVITVDDESTAVSFKNDPSDASRALNGQEVPEIKGWKTTVKTVNPINPAINIPVLYQEG